MGNISTKHLGGSSASRPSVAPNKGHPEQKPGSAQGNPSSKMQWRERGMNADKPAARKHKGE